MSAEQVRERRQGASKLRESWGRSVCDDGCDTVTLLEALLCAVHWGALGDAARGRGVEDPWRLQAERMFARLLLRFRAGEELRGVNERLLLRRLQGRLPWRRRQTLAQALGTGVEGSPDSLRPLVPWRSRSVH